MNEPKTIASLEPGEVVLNEYTKEEWADVYFKFLPNNTQEQYDADWDEFQILKAEHEKKKRMQ